MLLFGNITFVSHDMHTQNCEAFPNFFAALIVPMGACTSSPGSSNAVLLVGLDGAGSTTILYELIEGKYMQTIPTLGSNKERLNFNGVRLELYDIGGQADVRPLWHRFLPDANGVIFVVDSTDHSRFRSAGEELEKLFSRQKTLRGVPLLIFANKQDRPGAAPAATIAKQLYDGSVPPPNVRIFPCSGLDKDSLTDGMKWFTEELLKTFSLQ